MTAAFSPASATAGKSASLTLSADVCAAAWTGSFAVTGTSPSFAHTASAQLSLNALAAPVAAVTAPAANAKVSGTKTITATGTGCAAVAGTEIWIDGARFASASGGSVSADWDTTGAVDGAHTLLAKAYDGAGNAGTSSAVPVTVANSKSTRDFSFAVATSATKLNTGGAPAVYTITTGTTLGQPQRLQIAVSLPPGFSATPPSLSLTSGDSGQISIAATGAAAPGTASFSFSATGLYTTRTVAKSISVKDLTPPTFTLAVPPSPLSGTVQIALSGADNGGPPTLTLSLDGAQIATGSGAISVPLDTTALADGAHSLSVKAADAANNVATGTAAMTVQNSAATRDFSISLSPTSQAVAQGNATTYTITTATVSGAAQTLSLAAGAVPPGVTAQLSKTSLTSGGSATLTITAAANAPISSGAVSVSANGVYASHSASAGLTVKDVTPPAVQLAALANPLSGTARVSATASDNTALSSLALQIDGATRAASGTYLWDTTAETDGPHTVTAIATDSSGNSAQSSQAVTVQNSAATREFGVSISPANLSVAAGSSATFTVTTSSVAGAAQPLSLTVGDLPQGVTASLASASLTSGASTTLTVVADAAAPASSAAISVSANGVYASHVAQAQLAVLDTQAPAVSLSVPLNVSGTVDVEAAAQDNTAVATLSIWLDGAQVASSASWAWDTTASADGPHTLEARAYDAAGNLGSSGAVQAVVLNSRATRDFSVALSPSSSSFAQGASAAFTLSSSTSIGAPETLALTARFDGASNGLGATVTPAAIDSGSTSSIVVTATTSAVPGAGTLYVDACGTYGCTTVSAGLAVQDVTPPAIAFASPLDGAVLSGLVAISATASDNTPGAAPAVQLFLDGAAIASLLDTTAVADGAHLLQAVATDAAGNSATVSENVSVQNSPATRDFAIALSADEYTTGADGMGAIQVSTSELFGTPEPLALSVAADDGIGATLDAANVVAGGSTMLRFNASLSGNVTVSATGVYSTHSATLQVHAPWRDTQPPTVQVASPAGGTVSGTIAISAAAQDDVGVAGGAIYLDGALLVSSLSATWDTTTASDAAHTLTAVAYDAAGNQGTSAPVSITVRNTQLTRKFALAVTPTSQAVAQGQTAVFTINTTETSGAPQPLTLSVPGGQPGTYSLTPTRIVAGQSATLSIFTTATTRPYTNSPIYVMAAGVYVSLQVVPTLTVQDVTPPVVTISGLPDPSVAISGQTAITVNATDNTQSAAGATQLLVDGAVVATGSGGYLSKSLDTTAFADGRHTLTATCADLYGNVGSVARSILIANSSATRDFKISLSASSASIGQGGSTLLTLSSLQLRGSPEPLQLSASGPAGVTASFSSNTLTANQSVTVKVQAAMGASSGNLIVTATGVYASHFAAAAIAVSGTAPLTSISLADGSTVAGTVQITGTGQDLSGAGLAKLELLLDSTLLVATAAQSATASWDTTMAADASVHTLTARATDKQGTVQSSVARVTVQNSAATRDFSISLQQSATLPDSQPIVIPIATSEISGSPQRLSFSVTGTSGHAVYATFSPSNPTAGSAVTLTLTAAVGEAPGHLPISVVATGVYGSHSSPIDLTIVDTVPPTVWLSPPDGALVAGLANLGASATDNIGVTQTLELDLDGSPICTNFGSCQVAWDSRLVPDGAHVLTATAVDKAGNTAVATSRFSVSNAPTSHDLAVNGGFELGTSSKGITGWVSGSGVQVISGSAFDGTRSLQIAGSGSTPNTARQVFWIPKLATSAGLSLWYRATLSAAPPAGDYQEITVNDHATGALLRTLLHGQISAGWTQIQTSLAEYAGREVELRFTVNSSVTGGNTMLFADDVSLIVTPDGVGNPDFCTGAANVTWLDGDPGALFSGLATFTSGASARSVINNDGLVAINETSSTANVGVDFGLRPMSGPFLAEGAVRMGADYGPTLDVSAGSNGCNTGTGRWQIFDYTLDPSPAVRSFTATFEFQCEGIFPTLRGCVHFSQ